MCWKYIFEPFILTFLLRSYTRLVILSTIPKFLPNTSSSNLMLLQHIHYPSKTPILYTHALHIQEIFARQHLKHKALLSSSNPPPPSSQAKPTPKLLTFSTQPTYTTGLRDSRSLTPQQLTHLTATGAAHHASPRGGLTTYHGPGQITAFLITTLSYHGLTPRCYVHYLEDAVIRTAGI